MALPDGSHAVGLGFVVPADRRRKREASYHQMLAFVSGAAEVALTAAGSPKPVSWQTEEKLLAVLYRRATTARAGP